MKTQTVIDGKVTLYSYVDKEKRERISVCVVLPTHDFDNERLFILDWKMSAGNDGGLADSVVMTYQTRNDAYAPVYDQKFAIEKLSFAIKPPTKSKNWRWSDWIGADGGFQNQKTGEKSYA